MLIMNSKTFNYFTSNNLSLSFLKKSSSLSPKLFLIIDEIIDIEFDSAINFCKLSSSLTNLAKKNFFLKNNYIKGIMQV